MTAMRLDDLLRGIATPTRGDITVSGLTLDSHVVHAGDAFVALAGTRHHGIEFAPDAIRQGAVAVLADAGPGARDQGPEKVPGPGTGNRGPAGATAREIGTRGTAGSVRRKPGAPEGTALDFPGPWSPVAGSWPPIPGPVVWIENLRAHLGAIAARFNGDPSAALTVVGVTGTSGKTSTVQLLAQAFTHLGLRAATIGTLGSGLHGALQPAARTTPDVLRVHGLLAEFRAAGASHVAMEVSSHALDQHRVDGVHFDVAVFTNLSRDHLDYHGTMEAYFEAKAKLFAWPDLAAAVVDVDGAWGLRLAARIRDAWAHAAGHGRLIRYGTNADADVRATDIATHDDGTDFELVTPWGAAHVASRLLGRFNVANLLAVVGVLGALDVPFARIAEALGILEPVPGRMSRIGGGALPLVVVDYSHKPDALEQVLATLREHCRGRLTCVFGCGGERDHGKRPLMGAIAERLADRVIVTDDNPRGEDGDVIVAQIVAGMQAPERVHIERDRARAIDLALRDARGGDVVLIAGKGHETYQEVAGVKRPFDDLAVARATLGVRPC